MFCEGCRSFRFFNLISGSKAELLASCHDLRKQNMAREKVEVRLCLDALSDLVGSSGTYFSIVWPNRDRSKSLSMNINV